MAAFIAIAGGFGVWWWQSSGYVSTDDARIKAEIVAVSAELTAKLNSLTKEEGDAVARQEVLATLDRRELEICSNKPTPRWIACVTKRSKGRRRSSCTSPDRKKKW